MRPFHRHALVSGLVLLVLLSSSSVSAWPGGDGKLALETRGLGSGGRGIWMTNPNGVGLERLVTRGSAPAWSANGAKVAFSDDRSGSADIYWIRARGGAPTRVTKGEADDLGPAWSPNGDSIVFTRASSSGTSLRVWSTGTGVEALPNTSGGRDAAWSPDGQTIAFSAPDGGSRKIRLVDVGTGNVTTLTVGLFDDSNPTWSPNGERLAFERRLSESNSDIFVIDADGTDLEQLTTAMLPDRTPAWAPSGDEIAYFSARVDPGVFAVNPGNGSTRRIKSIPAADLDWQPCPGGECPGGRAQRVETTLRLDHEKTKRRIEIGGRMRPTLEDARVEVSLARRKAGGSFVTLSTKVDDTSGAGAFEAGFERPSKGDCKVTATYEGDDNYAPASRSVRFECGLPLHLATYSPRQLPANTERALERIPGVEATTVWSGSKFMKKSRAAGRTIDNPAGRYTIPLDVAFVEPREFAAFAESGDRDAIRSLDGRRGLLAKDAVGLRGGHSQLRMRFTVGRARTTGAISTESAQGYELILPQPAPVASRAFRTVLISKPPGVRTRRIARKIRDLIGAGTPFELSSEKQVPYLRHAQLVRPQLFVKKAFGEFALRPAGGRSISIGGKWVGRNIKTDGVPILGRVTCHRKIFSQLRGAMRELKRKGLASAVTRSNYAGCFNPRFISAYSGSGVGPVDRLSRHSWGIALDINARSNPFGRPPRQNRRFVRIMRKWGFTWGGRWSLPDGMHFEWERFPRR